jgi:hypothetical protein
MIYFLNPHPTKKFFSAPFLGLTTLCCGKIWSKMGDGQDVEKKK